MSLPKITRQQQRISTLFFSLRYITSSQFQNYLDHKSSRQTNKYLKDLLEKKYVRKIEENVIEYSQSTIYFTGRNGIRFLAKLNNLKARDLKNRYQDGKRSQIFIYHNLLLTIIFLQLQKESKMNNTNLTFQTKANFGEGSILKMLHPDAYIIQEKEDEVQQFFVEIIDQNTPRFVMRRRARMYIKYFLNNSVEVETGEDYPIVLLVCPTEQVKRRLITYIAKCLDDQGAEDLVCKITTVEKVRALGINNDIWKRVV